MEYLKNFNLTAEDIEDIITNIDDQDVLELEYNQERVEEILNYLISLGIEDVKSILMYKVNIFYDDIDSIKRRIQNYNGSDLIELINEDVINFDLVGI